MDRLLEKKRALFESSSRERQGWGGLIEIVDRHGEHGNEEVGKINQVESVDHA
jgi:hypothetical protein